MSEVRARDGGIMEIGEIPWGTHCCQLYRTRSDLLSTLVPFFEAGLRDHESCVWVTHSLLDADAAETAMLEAVPEFKRYVASGQIAVRDADDWYGVGTTFDGASVLAAWLERERLARRDGWAGLRLSGDTSWVGRDRWNDVMAYEQAVHEAFRLRAVLALCTYRADRCDGEDVRALLGNHHFALARGACGAQAWEILRSAGAAAPPGVAAAAPRRVLVVDDNADAAESLVMLLELMGHAAWAAGDGETALATAAAVAPEIVLLDIGIPGMDGYEVARRLRALPATRGSFLVAVTGYGRAEDRRRAQEAGFDRHELKPLDPNRLDALLAPAVAGAAAAATPPPQRFCTYSATR